jgi:hypothetical protein
MILALSNRRNRVMKLRLFGCAAAFVLAGTLCVSAQEAEPKMKESPSNASPRTESKGSSRATEMKESRENGKSQGAESAPDRGKADRADRKEGPKETGARENRPGNDDRPNKKDKADTAADKSDKDRQKGTSSAGAEDTKPAREKSAEQDGASKSSPTAQSKQDGGKAEDQRAKSDQASDRNDQAGKNVQLSAEKRDRVQSSFKSDLKLKRETKVDVDISIGSRAPRTWAFAPVPVTVVEIVPEYRGYVVAYVEDEYVICDPDTYEIVAVLPASSSDSLASTGRSTGEAGTGGKCSASLTLSETERTAILTEVEMSEEVGISGVTVGWSVPSDIELRTLPNSVVDRYGELSACRYFVVDDQVALVDPDEDKVVLLIDHE